MTYSEWLTTRTERVPGRCGGRLTFKDSRLEVSYVGSIAAEHGPEPAVDLYPYLSLEDATFAGRFYKELFK